MTAQTPTTAADRQWLLDPARLAALRASGLVADRIFPGLDRLVAITMRAVGTPMAFVSLVEQDRQWFASAAGLVGPWADERQTPLTHSFCQYVVDTDAPLAVSDARADPKLRCSLAIAELDIIAYAGFPLHDPTGSVLGAFCAADRQPREWTAHDLRLLEDLAAVAGSEVAALLAAEEIAEARLAAERQRAFLDALLESLDTMVVACDDQCRLVLFNRAMRDGLEADADPDWSPCEWSEQYKVYLPDGSPIPGDRMPLVRALAGTPVRDFEHLLHTARGRVRRFLSHTQPIVGPGGALLGAVSAMHDITERHRRERIRAAELAVHRAFVVAEDAAAAGPLVLRAVVTSLDCFHGELWLHDAAHEALTAVATWTHPGHVPVPVPARLPFGQGLAGETWRTGAPVWVGDVSADPGPLTSPDALRSGIGAALGVPIHAGAEVIGALTVFAALPEPPDDACAADLTGIAAQIGEFLQRRRAEDLAQELARSKDEYIALVGHELRTPLTSVAAYLDLVADAGDDTPIGELRDLLEVVQRNSTQLRGIIDDLLDLAALDAGHLVITREPVDLAELVRHSVAAARPHAAVKDLRLDTDVARTVPLSGSAPRLSQLIDNLVGNAVKYTPGHGRVLVRLRGEGGTAELTVTDSGVGVPADERDLVFRRFYRSSLARTLAIPGTGLGLPLCRTIVERHHGTIELSDGEGGTGTTVTVRLPLTT